MPRLLLLPIQTMVPDQIASIGVDNSTCFTRHYCRRSPHNKGMNSADSSTGGSVGSYRSLFARYVLPDMCLRSRRRACRDVHHRCRAWLRSCGRGRDDSDSGLEETEGGQLDVLLESADGEVGTGSVIGPVGGVVDAVVVVAVWPALLLLCLLVVAIVPVLVEHGEQPAPPFLPDSEDENVEADPREELQQQIGSAASFRGFWTEMMFGRYKGNNGAEHSVRDEQHYVPKAKVGEGLVPVSVQRGGSGVVLGQVACCHY
ncbi:hypothetical protein PG991_005464 [Apiospora marii]|uniref:Uncharacterized protein n=1 Tax=Apiospora marii TaxID=335849 RepID=A0ABR1SAN9_9PEZI